MDIKEIQQKKIVLENTIQELLLEFSQQTKLYVDYIEIVDRVRVVGGETVSYIVKVDARL